MACWAFQRVGNLLAGDGAEQAAVFSGFGIDFHRQALEPLGDFFRRSPLPGLLRAPGFLLQLHGVQIVGRGLHSQLPGQQEIAPVTVGNFHQLGLFCPGPSHLAVK